VQRLVGRVRSLKLRRNFFFHNSTTTSRLSICRGDGIEYWTGGRVKIEPVLSVLHVVQRPVGCVRSLKLRRNCFFQNSTTISRLSIYRKDGIEYWTGGRVEIEPALSVLYVVKKRAAWMCWTHQVTEATPHLTFPQYHNNISFIYI
jgi:hypothetical protein